MTKREEFRQSAIYIKGWNEFAETETGKAFLEVINEGVLKTIQPSADETAHGTAYRGGITAGASQIQDLIRSLHAQAITEEERKKAQNVDQSLSRLLPTQRAAVQRRLESYGNPTQ